MLFPAEQGQISQAGRQFPPELRGKYWCSAKCNGLRWYLLPDGHAGPVAHWYNDLPAVHAALERAGVRDQPRFVLYRTNCLIPEDFGKPCHTLTELGSGTREELLALQDQDVLVWQTSDTQQDASPLDHEPPDGWDWESDDRNEFTPENGLRRFAERGSDGRRHSIAYHLLERP